MNPVNPESSEYAPIRMTPEEIAKAKQRFDRIAAATNPALKAASRIVIGGAINALTSPSTAPITTALSVEELVGPCADASQYSLEVTGHKAIDFSAEYSNDLLAWMTRGQSLEKN